MYRGIIISLRVYSCGPSETMLGNTIKELQLPREELVILTKVRAPRNTENTSGSHLSYADMRAGYYKP